MCCLLSFGDSWPCGGELRPGQEPYPVLMSGQLGQELWPYSHPGSSIPHLLVQLRTALERLAREPQNHAPVAIFFLTSPHRDMIWGTQARRCDGHSTASDTARIMHINPANPEDRAWYQNIHSAELVSFRTNMSLIALQSMCGRHGIRDYYIWGWETVALWPEVDVSRFWAQGKRTVWQEFSSLPMTPENLMRNPYIFPCQGHPNQQGHAKIAEILVDHIRNS